MKKVELNFIKICVLIVIFLSIWGAIVFYINYIVKPKLKKSVLKNMIVLNGGIVTKIEYINKVSGLLVFNYMYFLEEKKYENKNNIGVEIKNYSANLLLRRNLPIAYEKGNPNNSFLLIKPSDFEYFNIPFPDSLKWIITDVIDK